MSLFLDFLDFCSASLVLYFINCLHEVVFFRVGVRVNCCSYHIALLDSFCHMWIQIFSSNDSYAMSISFSSERPGFSFFFFFFLVLSLQFHSRCIYGIFCSQSPVFDIVFLFLFSTVTVMNHKDRQMITDTMSPLIKLLSIKLVKIFIIY